jgi:hypothetical protein
MTKKIISVVGATGIQGGSVITALLKDSDFSIRALTRKPESDAAKALRAQGVQVVTSDVNDLSSLVAGFEGSSAIYAVTDFFEPFGQHGAEKAMEIEVEQGVNLAKAASATKTLEHYIWSTLPNGRKVSGGKFLIPHFDAKNKIDDHIKADANLFAKTTFLWVTFYASNYYFPMYTPLHVPTAGKYIQMQGTPPTVPIKTIGDARTNVGLFVKSILAQPQQTLPGRVVLAYAEETTAGDMLQTWAKAQGKTAQYIQVDEATFNAIWPMWAEEIGVQMQYWNEVKDRSWSGESSILTKEDLNVTDLIGLEDAFTALKFNV